MGKTQITTRDTKQTFSIRNGSNIAGQLHVHLYTLNARRRLMPSQRNNHNTHQLLLSTTRTKQYNFTKRKDGSYKPVAIIRNRKSDWRHY